MIQLFGMPDDDDPRVFGKPCADEVVPEALEKLPRFKLPKEALEDWEPHLVEEAFHELADADSDDYSEVLRNIIGAYKIDRQAFGKWCKANEFQLPQFWSKQRAKSAPARRGAPERFNWHEFYCEVIRIANQSDGLPEKQVELENTMAQWCLAEWGQARSVSTIREKIGPNYREARKGR